MSKSIKVILYKADTKEFSEETINDWRDYSKLLGCRNFDIVAPDDNLSIYVDDEGLMVEGNPIVEVRLFDGREVQLAGNIILAGGVDPDGNTMGFVGGIELAKEIVFETDLEVGYGD